MAPIQVFVFMDFGCERGNTENLTEVSLLAVPRSHFLQPENIEEPQDKLTLDDLWRSGFNMDVYKEINDFINPLPTPVCLVCHNGHRLDFIVLKKQLQKLNVSLSDDLLCADSLYAFYDILKEKHFITDKGNEMLLEFKSSQLKNNSSESNKQALTKQEISKDTQENQANKNEVTCHDLSEEQSTKQDLTDEEFIKPSTSNVNHTCKKNDVAAVASIDAVKKDHIVESEADFPNEDLENYCSIQQQNEKTPEKQKLDVTTTSVPTDIKRQKLDSHSLNASNPGNAKRKLEFSDEKHKYNGRAVRTIFYENDPKPVLKYKLGAIYDRIVKYPDVEHHPAENDVYMQFRISHKLGKRFLDWTDQIQLKFSAVEIKEIVFNN